jgi:Fibronectin type III-like domain
MRLWHFTQPKANETPLHGLAGFKRIHLGAGESTHVSMTMDPRLLAKWTQSEIA